MKTLDEINKEILILKDKILCQEIGNDTYYLSPIYHQHILKLEALKSEADVLNGKSAPVMADFDGYPPQKSKILKKIAEENGTVFANNYKHLSTKDLLFIINLSKKN